MKEIHVVPRGTEICDVAVVGGGSAGVVAAIQAAREGARVLLVEKNGILGGTAVSAGVSSPALFHAWGRQVVAGIPWEIIERTDALGGARLPDPDDGGRFHGHYHLHVNRLLFASVLDAMCLEAGVELRLHTMLADAQEHGGDEHRVRLLLATKEGPCEIRARSVVDATGDADVAGLLGLPREKGSHLQPGTLVYRLEGYDPRNVDLGELARRVTEALAAGELRHTDFIDPSVPWVGQPAEKVPLWHELVTQGGNRNHIPGVDGSTVEGRTRAELEGRRALVRLVRFLRSLRGCEKIAIREFGPECGIRETWRIVGNAFMDHERYTSGYVWPDAICFSFYPIDVHSWVDNTINLRPLAPGVVATVPFGALVPRGSDALVVAGRTASGDQIAHSAYRTQASAMATGQAAGAAAAMVARRRCPMSQLPIRELQDLLRRHGALLPTTGISTSGR